MKTVLTAVMLVFSSLSGLTAAPRVVTDILPVQALVQQVLGDLGRVDVLVGQGGEPHEFALRPSQARALASADLVVQIGPALTPWLNRALPRLAPDASVVSLLDLPETTRLTLRTGPVFNGDSAATAVDPHAWLDPENALVWLDAIRKALSQADPDNADTYSANAAAAKATIETLKTQINAMVQPIRQVRFMVDHDAFQYFENRFGLHALASISDTEATTPGAARIRTLGQVLAAAPVACLFVEAGANQTLAQSLVAGTPTKIVEIDPLGSFLDHASYADLLLDLAQAIANCE